MDIAKDAEWNFETSHYQLERTLPIGKKVIGLSKNEFDKK